MLDHLENFVTKFILAPITLLCETILLITPTSIKNKLLPYNEKIERLKKRLMKHPVNAVLVIYGTYMVYAGLVSIFGLDLILPTTSIKWTVKILVMVIAAAASRSRKLEKKKLEEKESDSSDTATNTIDSQVVVESKKKK